MAHFLAHAGQPLSCMSFDPRCDILCEKTLIILIFNEIKYFQNFVFSCFIGISYVNNQYFTVVKTGYLCSMCKIEIETFQFVALTKVTHVYVNKCQVHNCD